MALSRVPQPESGTHVQALYLDFYSHLAELVLHDRRGLVHRPSGPDDPGKGQPLSALRPYAVGTHLPPGVVQYLLRHGRIVGVYLVDLRIVAEGNLLDGRFMRLVRPLVQQVAQRLPVDRVLNGDTNGFLARGEELVVEEHDPRSACNGRNRELDVRVLFQVGQIVRPDIVDNVRLSCFQCAYAGQVLGNNLVRERIHVRGPRMVPLRPPVVILEPDECKVVVRHIFLQHEGARSGDVELVLVAPLLHRGRGQYRYVGGAAHVEKSGEGFLELDFHRVLVNHLTRIEGSKRAACNDRPGLGIHYPVETELDRLGIERSPVVERNVLSQIEGVLGCVAGDLVGFRETRVYLRTPLLLPEQRVVYLRCHGHGRLQAGHLCVERLGRLPRTVYEVASSYHRLLGFFNLFGLLFRRRSRFRFRGWFLLFTARHTQRYRKQEHKNDGGRFPQTWSGIKHENLLR